ncbi:MAG: RNA polymerase sigma factor [Candidatus Woesebacteria bacterium]|jgi:RNA polymerase sigma-70 factor (ECF subfamily)
MSKKNKQLNDLKLISQIKRGNAAAIKQWFLSYQPILLNIALKKVKTTEDAEELVQETFISCLKNATLFQEKSSLQSWMIAILRHEIADYYRKLYAKKAIRTLPLGELLLKSPVNDSHETSNKVKEVLKKMMKEKRELLLLKYVDKKKVKEIAKRLGRTTKSVESDLFRARKEFRELYLLLEK